MDTILQYINDEVYQKLSLRISKFQLERESKEYAASTFELSERSVVCRNAKLTPKKNGQFVTFWKRSEDGPIEPFEDSDQIDFFVVNVKFDDRIGQFVFPKSELIKRRIISTEKREGKRAFRVYPEWDVPKSDQARRTQKWQLAYFYELDKTSDLEKVAEFYQFR